MLCIYHETLYRSRDRTEFLVQPLTACKNAVDGLLRCTGKISVYQCKMPLDLQGDHDETGKFHVTEERIQDEEIKDGKSPLLDYLAPGFTVPQRKRLSGKVMDLTMDQLIGAKIRPEKAARFLNRRSEFTEERKLVKILEECGVDGDSIENALDRKLSLKALLKDPYKACQYNKIDIYSADQIAKAILNIHPYAPMRLIGFVKDAMNLSSTSGDTCTTFSNLKYLVNYRLKQSAYPDTVINYSIIYFCVKEAGFCIEGYDDQIYVYTKSIHDEEASVAEHIQRIQGARRQLEKPDIASIEKKCGITFNPDQRKAFAALETTGIKIITGPPGTGKTALIKGMIEGRKGVRLSATTGRASQVLSRATGKEAVTVHKMLDIRPFGDNLTSKDINNPIDAELIVVDETSMMGLGLAAKLLGAVKSDTTLILVGDEDQLQSVEYGNVLGDLILCGKIEVYRLNVIMRQKGTLMENILRIRAGRTDMIRDSLFELLEFSDDEQALQELLKRNQPGSHVLTTVRGNALGIYNLNRLLQKKDGKYCMSYGRNDFYAGDPVIMGRTDYDKGYYNGETGIVRDKTGPGLLVQFSDHTICLEREDLADTDLAYAITIHKSQGDEYDDVHILLPACAPGMLIRRIVYTAVTRARRKVTIYSVNHSFETAVNNKKEKNRMTNLANRIIIEHTFDFEK